MPRVRFRVRVQQRFRFVPKHKSEVKGTLKFPGRYARKKLSEHIAKKRHAGKFEQGASQKGAFTPTFQSAGAAYSRQLREESR